MTLTTAIDDRGGILFNGRRQSRDRVLRARLFTLAGDGGLWVTPFTAKQFKEGEPIERLHLFTEKAELPADAFVFMEDIPASALIADCDRFILYRWNRDYPGDVFLDADLTGLGFTLQSTADFEGHSHEKITEEVYTR